MSAYPVRTPMSPPALGAYSQAVKVSRGPLYISGQLGMDPMRPGVIINGGVKAQTLQALRNMEAILIAANGSVKVTNTYK